MSGALGEVTSSDDSGLRWIWAVCMVGAYSWVLECSADTQMTGFNFFSHGSQDLYPKMLEEAKGLSIAQASRATIISNCGADELTPPRPRALLTTSLVGGTIAGYASQYVGRRLA